MPVATTTPVPMPVLPLITRPAADIDVPQSLFIDFAGRGLAVDWKAVCGNYPGGVFRVILDPATKAEFLDVRQFRRINVEVAGTKAKAYLAIGKCSGSTLAMHHELAVCDPQQGGVINSFEVTGPEIGISLSGGPGLGVEKVQLWVYLRS